MPEELSERPLTTEQLSSLREKTEAISKFLESQLRGYLDTLRPVLAPRRLFGRHVGVKEDVPGSDRAMNELKKKYQEVCRQPYALVPELPDDALSELEFRPELCAWEYPYAAKTDGESKTITITSPVRWILTYGSGLTLSQLRQLVAKKSDRQPEAVRQFVLSALAMHVFMRSSPNLARLFTDLRYEIHFESVPGLGDLPFVTIRSCLPSFRPSDDLLLTATRFSGVAAFIELIDLDAARTVADPLRVRLQELLT